MPRQIRNTRKKEVTECARYIKNNRLGIMVRIDDGGAVWGCSAEGHISHVLSARESSRPMGWSKKGVDRISRLRVLTRNEQKIIDLMEYQDKNVIVKFGNTCYTIVILYR